MVITFLVGNGLDLRLGLQTSYRDFYQYLDEKKPKLLKDNIIFVLIQDEPENWADFEKALGEYSFKREEYNKKHNQAYTKDEWREKYTADKQQMHTLLMRYLAEEQVNYIVDDGVDIRNVLTESLLHFDAVLANENQKNAMRDFMATRNSADWWVRILNFNYTNPLLQCAQLLNDTENPDFGAPILLEKGESRRTSTGHTETSERRWSAHLAVNGRLDSGMIVGVDNEGQLDESFCEEERTSQNFLKNLDRDSGDRELKRQASEYLENSNIICVFGMSFGETDQIWWSEIADLLALEVTDEASGAQLEYLVLFDYHTEFAGIAHQNTQVNEEIDRVREDFFTAADRMDLYDDPAIRERVFVGLESDKLFRF